MRAFIILLLVMMNFIFVISCLESTETEDEVKEEEVPIEEQIQDYKNKGWESFDNENYSEAIDNFNQVIALDQNDTSTLCGLGWAKCFSGDYLGGMDFFIELLEENEVNVCANLGLGIAHSATNSHDKSLPYLERILNESNGDISISTNLTIPEIEIHKRIALSYYFQNNAQELKIHIDKTSPGHGIIEDNPSTWVKSDSQLPRYIDALLFVILD